MSSKFPTLGRIVHYIEDTQSEWGGFPERTAIVVEAVPHDAVEGPTGLRILHPGGTTDDYTVHVYEGQEPGTWHWPERV